MKVVMFSKHLQELSIEDAGRAAVDIGFDGLDLTVRPGGHVTPDGVEEALPAAVETLRAVGAEVPMMTTAITDADDDAEATLRAAKAAGITRVKLGYWRYQGFGKLRGQIAEVRECLARIEPLALEAGVTACLHNHSGNDMTASSHVIAALLRGFDPDALGAYIDPGHMTVEGGRSGWKIGMDALHDRVRMMALKDFGWFRNEADGQVTWSEKLVPLSEGIVRWDEVFECLAQIDFDGIVSFHSEYQGGHSWRDLDTDGVIAQTREDYAYMRSRLGR